jgi:NADH-quinone oxidoreductase subunit G
LENDEINECWISDRDRFSYEGLNSEDRLTSPMIKQDGKWIATDWQTALEYVAHGLRNIRHEHGSDSIAALATPYSTLEELSLLQKVVRGIGSENIDFRLRQSDFVMDGRVTPWLGMPVAEFSQLRRAFVIGSFLRKDHPLLAARLRQAAKRGAKISVLHASDDDLLMPVANKFIAAPSHWLAALSQIVVGVAQAKNINVPAGFENIEASQEARAIADSLLADEPTAVLLGNAAAQHPQAALLHAAAEWIAKNTNAKFGYLTEGANTVGGYVANAIPGANGANALQAFEQPRKAYLLFNAEPEFDSHNPQQARVALEQAEMVVVMSPFAHGKDYADVLLPIAPFSETSGTFVSGEGRAQSFNGTVKPLGETRPGWKVLRVLGNLLELSGFDYDSSETIRNEILGTTAPADADIRGRLNNFANVDPIADRVVAASEMERLAYVPIYSSDAIVRRAESLQKTADAQAPAVWISEALAQNLGVAAGGKINVKQGQGSAVLEVGITRGLPDHVVRVAASHPATAALGAMFGPISVEKA